MKIIPVYIGAAIIFFIVGSIVLMGNPGFWDISRFAFEQSQTTNQIDNFVAGVGAVFSTLYIFAKGMGSKT